MTLCQLLAWSFAWWELVLYPILFLTWACGFG